MKATIEPGQVIIQTTGLRKRYGDSFAVDGVDLTVYAGEIFGILGPNGAGKTTTLEMIEGLRQPDEGTVIVAGLDARTAAAEIRSLIGVQLQTTALFDYLTAGELIALFGNLYDVERPAARVDRLLQQVGLLEKRDARVDQMSGGQQQRLSIALGLVNDPVVAFLDEPTTGLDPSARRDLWQTVQNIRDSGATAVLTTHYMEEAELLCDRVAIMDRGQIIALDTPRELIRDLAATATINAAVEGPNLMTADLDALPGVVSAAVGESTVELGSTNVQSSLVALLDLASRRNVRLLDLRSSQPTLEDVFLALTGRSYVQELAEAPEIEQETPKGRGRFGSRR